MKNKTAGERKRTVTVTVGPKSWMMIEERMAFALKGQFRIELSPTVICASAIAQVLNQLRKPSVEPGNDDWICLAD